MEETLGEVAKTFATFRELQERAREANQATLVGQMGGLYISPLLASEEVRDQQKLTEIMHKAVTTEPPDPFQTKQDQELGRLPVGETGFSAPEDQIDVH